MLKNDRKYLLVILLLFLFSNLNAQPKRSATVWDGMLVAGYVNDGAFVNLGGPSVKFIKKPLTFAAGILPSLRIKEDQVAKGAKKNSVIMPTAGFGITVGYKHVVAQVPFYYNAKTATTDGKWNIGFGIGYRF